MDISLKHIGIIKNADIHVDGLTVITGKNSSGKTTVGKVAYSIVKANCNAQEAYDNDKETYLKQQLDKLRMLLFPTTSSISMNLWNEATEKQRKEDPLLKLLSQLYHFGMFYDNYQLLNDIYNQLEWLKAEDILGYQKKNNEAGELLQIRIHRYQEQFGEIKENAKELCRMTIDVLNSDESYRIYLHQRTKNYLNNSFHKQVKPVRNQESVSQIDISEKGHKCVSIRIKSGNDYVFDMDSSFIFPAEQAVFLDDPFILDRIAEDETSAFSKIEDIMPTKDSLIQPRDSLSDEDEMTGMIRSKRSVNFFDEMEMQKRYRSIFEKINTIVPGEFLSTNDGLFYLEKGIKLNIHNLATGSKLFFILKQLLLNGYLDNTLLVLDEPESHLHPEWIQKFAEVIILLVKDLQLKIILTTHSPDLLLALSVYSKDYNIQDLCHYYLAKILPGSWEAAIDCIDDHINEGYAHLSIPLLEMSVRNQQQMKEQQK